MAFGEEIRMVKQRSSTCLYVATPKACTRVVLTPALLPPQAAIDGTTGKGNISVRLMMLGNTESVGDPDESSKLRVGKKISNALACHQSLRCSRY